MSTFQLQTSQSHKQNVSRTAGGESSFRQRVQRALSLAWILIALATPFSAQAQIFPGGLGIPVVPDDLTDFQPFEYFDADQTGSPHAGDGNGMINAYLLAQLSDMIYADDIGLNPMWEAEFIAELIALGARDADFYNNDQSYKKHLVYFHFLPQILLDC